MRIIVGAAFAALFALPAHAGALGLMASPAQCAALESLVVFGLIDGGDGGDTTELTGVVDSGDGAACQSWLDDYGFGAGFNDEDCAAAWDIFAHRGLPEELSPEIPVFITTILSPSTMQDCEDVLFDLTVGR